MKLLITGGAGFIGSALIRLILRSTSHSVVNVDKLTYAGNLDSLNSVSKSQNYFFERVDICNPEGIGKIFKKHKPDCVMHLAAESHVDRSIEDPSNFIKTNIFGTYNLLEESRKYFERLKNKKKSQFRFHHISTDEVYGDLGDTKNLFTEKSSYLPSSPYSSSKASSDHLVRAWGRTYNLPVIITNCSNNYGPYHFPEKLIPHMILSALSGKKLPIYGNGLQIRDWLYVEDHARALLKVITEGQINETYNIGGNNEKTNLEVVETVCDLLEEFENLKPKGVKEYRDLITFVRDRPGHDLRYAIDATKIKNELNWMPTETFETGMRKTIKWYINNMEWSQNILSGEYLLKRMGDIHE